MVWLRVPNIKCETQKAHPCELVDKVYEKVVEIIWGRP